MQLPKRLVLIALAIVMVAACATTAKGRYGQSLASFNDLMDSYRYQYSMQDPVTQANWDAQIAPYLLEASMALDQWELAQNDATKEQAFITLERKALELLIKNGVITKEVPQ